MDKQELLEYIAPYLPYNVKAQLYFNGKKQHQVVNSNKTLDLRTVAFYIENYDHIGFKIILHPLSDLTKPCLEGGRIPIVELAKMCGYNNLEQFEIDGEIEYGWSEHGLDDYQGYSFGWSRELKTLGVWLDHIEGLPISIDLNLDVVQFMYKHHFDIHGLIEKGFAIDINML